MTHHTSDRPRTPQAPNRAPIEPPDARTVAQANGAIRVEMRSKRRAIVLRLVFLLVSGVALYVLWPSLLTVFESWPELLDLNPAWFLAMLVLEALSFVCIWGLQRIALRTDRWFGVATAQLSANALSRVVPGGAAAGGAMNVRVLGADLLTVHIPDDREMPVTFLQARLKRCRRTAK